MLGQAISPKKIEALANYLVEKGFIRPGYKDRISPDSVFTSLHEINLAKHRFSRLKRGLMSILPNGPGPNARFEELIHKLFSLQLIDLDTKNDLAKKLQTGLNPPEGSWPINSVIFNESDLFLYLSEKEQQEKNKQLIPAYINQLKEKGLISHKTELEEKSLQADQILSLIDKKIIIHKQDLPDSLKDRYNFIFQEVFRLFPSIRIPEINVYPTLKTYGSSSFHGHEIVFTHEGIEFRDFFAEGMDYVSELPTLLSRIFIEKKIPLRFAYVYNTDNHIISFLLLNQEQFHFLSQEENESRIYFDPFNFRIKVRAHPDIFSLLTQKQIEGYFSTYDSLGLLSHLNDEEKGHELNRLKGESISSAEDILYEIENVCQGFDWEMSDGDQPYKKAILEFAAITRGEFTPTKIKDGFSFEKEKAYVSFDFKGKTYQTSVDVFRDWYDEAFLMLINKALEENDLSGKFYDLPDGGQTSSHIYLTEDQYKFLVANKLLEFYQEPDYQNKN
ncbi:MAG: hypothetical protein AAGI38_24925 [Bacteroidota bacterium]